MKMNLDITKPGQSEPIFCQSLGASFYCSLFQALGRSVQTSEKSGRAVKKRASERKRQKGENL